MVTNLTIDCSGFPEDYSELNGKKEIQITQPMLIWAAITVGAPNYAAALGSDTSGLAFAIHKGLAIVAATNWKDQLAIPKGYDALDQSEKVVLSYWMGMAVSKLVAAELLRVPWLLHARPLQAKGLIETSPLKSRSLPDLVGTDGELRWHVIEAKGRQKRPTPATKQQWKTQAERVNLISNSTPATRSHCLTISNSKSYSVEMVDPSPDAEYPSIDVSISRNEFLRAYYHVYQQLLTTFESEEFIERNDMLYRRVACDPATNVVYEIGANRRVLALAHHEPSRLHPLEAHSSNSEHIGSDGIAVRISPS